LCKRSVIISTRWDEFFLLSYYGSCTLLPFHKEDVCLSICPMELKQLQEGVNIFTFAGRRWLLDPAVENR
jgi:hypothetical protein